LTYTMLRATADALTCGLIARFLARFSGSIAMKRSHDDAALLLVGLHNPGARYESTRHNAGAMALETIVGRNAFDEWSNDEGADAARGTLDGISVLAMRPGSFMNLSGRSVAAAAKRHGLSAAQVVVLHDDLDLAPGRVKIKKGGSSGGHRGLESCTERLGGADYWRVRIGIGRPAEKRDVPDYVLARFKPDELAPIEASFSRLALTAQLLPAALRQNSALSTLLNALASDANAASAAARAKAAAADATAAPAAAEAEGGDADEGGPRKRRPAASPREK